MASLAGSDTVVIDHIPERGYRISKPGHYVLGRSLGYRPRGAGAAILITASDVVLDLAGHTLRVELAPEAAALRVDGIRVTGARGVVIRNGTVHGASSCGIAVRGACDVTLEDLRVEHMRATDSTSKTTTPAGLSLVLTCGFRVRRCVVADLRVLAASLAGVTVHTSSYGCLEECEVTGLDNRDGGAMGYALMMCAGVAVRRCVARQLTTHYQGVTPTSGHTCIGFLPLACAAVRFDDCAAEQMTGCCDDAHGISVFLDALVAVNRFRAAHVVDGECVRKTGAKATGIEVYGLGVVVRDSHAEHITARVPQDRQSAGFAAWGVGLLFDRCRASHVAVLDAAGAPSTADGYGVGFGWAPDPRVVLRSVPALCTAYWRCVADDCQVGFDTWNHIASAWLAPRVANTPVPVLRSPWGARRILSMDRCSESPSGHAQRMPVRNRSCANFVGRVDASGEGDA